MRKGYGLLITRARESMGMEPEDLAERIGQSPATVRRLESEFTEPSVKQINALVTALPLSAEELLRNMGVSLNPPAATRLPREMVADLLELTPDGLVVVQRIAHALRQAQSGSDG